MLNTDFETQKKADLDKIFAETLIRQAVSFEEYFSNSLRNEFWDSERTLLARINRYKEFCLQKLEMGKIRKYFDYPISNQYEMELVAKYKTMNLLLRDFSFAFKPEYVAFFNIKDAQKGTKFKL